MHRIGEVEDIDDAMEGKLTGLGIRTTDDFLARAATPAARAELAGEVGSTAATVLTWANCADLMRVDGIGMQFADLLEAAGVDTIPELAQRNAHTLHERVGTLNAEQKLAGRAPTEAEVEAWVAQAKQLPRILEYTGAAASSQRAVPDPSATAEGAASAATQTTDTAGSASQNARSAASGIGPVSSSAGATGAGWWQKLMARVRGH